MAFPVGSPAGTMPSGCRKQTQWRVWFLLQKRGQRKLRAFFSLHILLRRERYYDRNKHTFGADQWPAVRRLVFDGRRAGVLDAGRICHGGGRLYPRQKHRQYPDEKPDGFLHRLRRVYSAGLRPAFGRGYFLWPDRYAKYGHFDQLRQL